MLTLYHMWLGYVINCMIKDDINNLQPINEFKNIEYRTANISYNIIITDNVIVKLLIIFDTSNPYFTGIVLILFFLSSIISLLSAKLLLPNNNNIDGT